jgi:hypothetical protein
MGSIQSNQRRPVLAAAAVFLCAGLSVASLFLKIGLGEITRGDWASVIALLSPLIFLCACVLVFVRPTAGFVLGGAAGVTALPWFVLTESSPLYPSIWIYLNGPDDFAAINTPYAALKILSVAFTLTAVACSALRLLPSGLLLRNRPLSRRTWPAVAVTVLVLLVWLHHSAAPWMLPTIVDAGAPDLRILHVQKRGLQFHETTVKYWRDGRFWVNRCDRRLFQYRFQNRSTDGVMPPGIRERADALAHSTPIRSLRTARPVALRSWNAEGWYVVLSDSPLLAFTTESGTNPPPAIVDVHQQMEQLPGTQRSFAVQDVCLGFCYDPVAGLGFWFSNQRCHALPDGASQCL